MTRAPISLLVVDDHPVVRDGVRMLISADRGITLAGAASTGADAVRQARALQPDVVLLDLRLPDVLASEVIGQLKAAAPRARVVVFTAYGEHAALRAVLDGGADGCLLKDAGHTDLVRAIRRVAEGVRVFDPRLADRGAPGEGLARVGLSRREYDVLRLVATGKTNPEIAQELGLARNTVKAYLQAAMQKLGARNRVDALRRAHEADLL